MQEENRKRWEEERSRGPFDYGKRRDSSLKRSGGQEAGESSQRGPQAGLAGGLQKIPRIAHVRPEETRVSPLMQQGSQMGMTQLLIVGIHEKSELAKELKIRGEGRELDVRVPGTVKVGREEFLDQALEVVRRYPRASKVMIVLTPWILLEGSPQVAVNPVKNNGTTKMEVIQLLLTIQSKIRRDKPTIEVYWTTPFPILLQMVNTPRPYKEEMGREQQMLNRRLWALSEEMFKESRFLALNVLKLVVANRKALEEKTLNDFLEGKKTRASFDDLGREPRDPKRLAREMLRTLQRKDEITAAWGRAERERDRFNKFLNPASEEDVYSSQG